MYTYFVHFAKTFVKWWYFIQWLPNFLCLNETHSWWFWCRVCEFIIAGLWVMIFWIRVWQFVSHHWCPTSWFSLPCFLTSKWIDFLHEPTLVCLVYMWIFLELFVAFPNCLRFSPLLTKILTLCDTCSHFICEILILY